MSSDMWEAENFRAHRGWAEQGARGSGSSGPGSVLALGGATRSFAAATCTHRSIRVCTRHKSRRGTAGVHPVYQSDVHIF